MSKVYAGIASVGFLVLGSVAGCSSADPPTGSGGSSSTAGTTGTAGTTVIPMAGTSSGTGGTSSTAGTTATGGSSSTAGTPAGGTGSGTAGTAAGGTGTAGTGAGTGGTGNLACKGIKTNMACAPEGTDCPNLACGLADSGVRSCKCATTWMCAACDYSASPFKDKPADLAACSGIEADKVTCTEAEKGKVCSSSGGEVCACWTDDEGSLIWDCDKPPTTWAATP